MFLLTTRLHTDRAAHLVGEQHPALLLGPHGHPGPGLGRGAGGGGRQHLDKATVTIKTTNISEPPLRLVATTTTHCPCPLSIQKLCYRKLTMKIQIELSGVVSLLYVPDCGLLAIKCRQWVWATGF